ncbi:MAG: tRNA (adenosine(37)-N6)-threonylcarbamoyltransferase complex dimerization subunit type 1 TsaB [Pseudomonadota bacterium]
MKLLSIEAAASPASVALSIDGHVVEHTSDDPKAQAEQLLALTNELLRDAGMTLSDLDGVVVGRGPGSFTGLRVATAVAQGLAYSAGLPVAAVSTLAAVAHQVGAARAIMPSNSLLVCLDARKEQVYCAHYRFNELAQPESVSDEAVLDPAEVVRRFRDQVSVVASDAIAHHPILSTLGDVLEIAPSATAVARRADSGVVAFESPYAAVPRYVRDNVTHGG